MYGHLDKSTTIVYSYSKGFYVMLEDTQENALYIKAMRELNKAGKNSDHTKPAETSKEIDFMHDTNRVVSRALLSIPYKLDQYEKIFGGSQK